MKTHFPLILQNLKAALLQDGLHLAQKHCIGCTQASPLDTDEVNPAKRHCILPRLYEDMWVLRSSTRSVLIFIDMTLEIL